VDGATLGNAAELSTDIAGLGGADAASVTVIEPELELEKTNDAGGPIDAGDLVTYTLDLAHTAASSSAAYDIVLEDALTAGALQIESLISATLSGPGGAATDVSALFAFAGGQIFTAPGADLDLALGQSLELVYAARATDDVGPRSVLSNLAQATWSSFDGARDPGAQTGERDGSGGRGVNDHASGAASAVGIGSFLSLDKSVAGDDREVAVGETVTFFLDIGVLEGATSNLVVADLGGAGLEIDLSTLRVVDNGFAGAPISITDVTYDQGLQGGGALLGFGLDNDAAAGLQLINPGDNDPSNDVIRVAYDAVVLNQASNQYGTGIANLAAVAADGSDPVEDADAITVVEPDLAVSKTIVSPVGSVDAGDVVVYEVVLENVGTSTAFEASFEDPAPAGARFDPASLSVADGSGAPVAGFAISPDGAALTASGLQIAAGERIVISYALIVQDDVVPGQSLPNLARADWSSALGDAPGERDGSDGQDGALNDHAASAGAATSVAMTLGLSKSLVSTDVGGDAATDLVVGEVATFALDLTLGEGTTPSVTVTDRLPAGLAFAPGSLTVAVVTGAASFTAPIADHDPTTGLLTLDLGDVVGAGTADSTPGAPDEIVLRLTYDAVVENVAANRTGTTLSNAAEVATGSAELGGTAATPVDLAVIEPNLSAEKRVVSPAGAVDAGDLVTFEVVLTSDGAATAHDVVFADPLPAGLTAAGAPVAVDQTGTARGTFAIDAAGAIAGSGFDLAPGETLTVTYQARVDESVAPGDVFDNVADATWTSKPGDDAAERGGDDGAGGAPNDYATSAGASATTAFNAGLSKTLVSTDLGNDAATDVVVGEILTWRLDLSLTEGTTPGVVVVDAPAPGLGFVDLVGVDAPAGSVVADPTISVDPLTGAVTFDFGDVTVAGRDDADPGAPDERIVALTYRMRVLNTADAVDGATLGNAAELSTDIAGLGGADAAS
ncbi:MAG: hypothetical protein AAFZ09_02790, partial [Pseudomonadota bacterium]